MSVAVSRDGRLEVFRTDDNEEEKESAVAAVSFDPSTLGGGDGDDESLMSDSKSRAVVTVLALAVAQGRLLSSSARNADAAALALVEGVAALCDHDGPLRLPSDAEALAGLLASAGVGVPSAVVRRIVRSAEAALSAGRAVRALDAADAAAALSAERAGVDPSDCFAEALLDASRPHKGCVVTANRLRAATQGSRYARKHGSSSAGSGDDVSPETVAAVRRAPQVHGPAREVIEQARKTLELEINCSEVRPDDVLDDTVVELAEASLIGAVNTLRKASARRVGAAPTTDDDAGARGPEAAVDALYAALQTEVETDVAFVVGEATRARAEAKRKEEEKAKRAAALQAAKQQTSGDGNADEFAGMTEAQKKKILKKRAEKEAKAAKKKAAKASADDSPLSAVSSLFGGGAGPLVAALSESTAGQEKEEIRVRPLSSPAVAVDLASVFHDLLSGGAQRKPKIPKGTRDYLPAQMRIRQKAFDIVRRVFRAHGAVEIDTPVFELKETLTGKYGEDSKLIYDLADQGGESLALRYDLTVPFARFLASHPVGNIRRFHIGKVYRRDQPALSRGRYREFYQCDFDVAGSHGRMVPDAECVATACEILEELPIGVDFIVKLNHRRLLDAILDLSGVPPERFRTICSAVDKLDKEPWEEVRREMVVDKGLDPAVADKIGTFVLQKGAPWDMHRSLVESGRFAGHAGAETALEDLRIMFGYLEAMDRLKHVSFDLSLARGLDYYTGVIYEAACVSGDVQVGSIGGGGRYDNLVGMFQEGGRATPCVGVSVGIERVFTLMEKHLAETQEADGRPPRTSDADVLVASAGGAMLREKMAVARRLWDAKIAAEFSQADNVKLKNEIASALDRGVPFMVVVGEEEAKQNKCKIKDLRARTEETVPLDDLVKVLLRQKGVVPVGCEFAKELLAASNDA